MIIGDSTAHGGHAFHPAITKPPAADNDDGGDNTPIDPSAVQAVVASALATASLAMSSQFPTDTSLSCPLSSTLWCESLRHCYLCAVAMHPPI